MKSFYLHRYKFGLNYGHLEQIPPQRRLHVQQQKVAMPDGGPCAEVTLLIYSCVNGGSGMPYKKAQHPGPAACSAPVRPRICRSVLPGRGQETIGAGRTTAPRPDMAHKIEPHFSELSKSSG